MIRAGSLPHWDLSNESLLASTGEGTPGKLASRFAIDIKKPDFWRDSLKMIEQRIDQYVAL